MSTEAKLAQMLSEMNESKRGGDAGKLVCETECTMARIRSYSDFLYSARKAAPDRVLLRRGGVSAADIKRAVVQRVASCGDFRGYLYNSRHPAAQHEDTIFQPPSGRNGAILRQGDKRGIRRRGYNP